MNDSANSMNDSANSMNDSANSSNDTYEIFEYLVYYNNNNDNNNIIKSYKSTHPLVKFYLLYKEPITYIDNKYLRELEEYDNKYSNTLLGALYLKLNKKYKKQEYGDKGKYYLDKAISQNDKHAGYLLAKSDLFNTDEILNFYVHSADLGNLFAMNIIINYYKYEIDILKIASYIKKTNDTNINYSSYFIIKLFDLYNETHEQLLKAKEQIEEMELSPLPGRQFLEAQKSFNTNKN